MGEDSEQPSGEAAASLALAMKLDTSAAGALHEALTSRAGGDVVLDGADGLIQQGLGSVSVVPVGNGSPPLGPAAAGRRTPCSATLPPSARPNTCLPQERPHDDFRSRGG